MRSNQLLSTPTPLCVTGNGGEVVGKTISVVYTTLEADGPRLTGVFPC